MTLVFSDTEAKPTGRKARTVPSELWPVLADSAKRDVAKVVEADETVITELLKDLGSAAVRKKYTLTTATKALETGGMRLTFHAAAKPQEAASQGQEQERPATRQAGKH